MNSNLPKSGEHGVGAGQTDVITLDLVQARENFGCDEALLHEIANVFIEDVPLIVAELQEACARKDAPTVCRLAHSLKGLCATFGAEPARTYAQGIECNAATHRESAVTCDQVRVLVRLLERTIATLRSELRSSA
jgi:HPt (histidine-containing phosphotransfer) domain-containing protein